MSRRLPVVSRPTVLFSKLPCLYYYHFLDSVVQHQGLLQAFFHTQSCHNIVHLYLAPVLILLLKVTSKHSFSNIELPSSQVFFLFASLSTCRWIIRAKCLPAFWLFLIFLQPLFLIVDYIFESVCWFNQLVLVFTILNTHSFIPYLAFSCEKRT